jgi:4-amino-4-deoxy-L-arabinose transferase-like glycosyltransferase
MIHQIVNKKTTLVLLLIILISLGIKLFYLPNFNLDRRADEGVYYFLAKKMSANFFDYTTRDSPEFNSWGELYKRPLFHHPPLYPFMISIIIRLFGSSWTYAAFVNIIAHTITLIFVFLIAKDLYNEKVALLASGFMAFDPMGLILSGRIWIDGTLMLWLTISFYFFIKGKKSERNYYLCGIFLGLAFLTKASAYPMIAIYFIILKFRVRGIHFKAFFLAIVVFSPWILWNLKLGLNPFYFKFVQPDQIEYAKLVMTPWYTSILGLVAINPVFLFSLFGIGYLIASKESTTDGLLLWALIYLFVFSFLVKLKGLYYLAPAIPPLLILASWYFLELHQKVTNLYPKASAGVLIILVLIIIYNVLTSAPLSKIYLVQGARLFILGKNGYDII